MSKLFFEVEAINVNGYKNKANIAFESVIGISDYSPRDPEGTIDQDFLDNVKCIMMLKEGHKMFCCEDRLTLTARIERECTA